MARAPDEVHSAQMGVDHALSMLRNGKDVAILLDVNGVNLGQKCNWRTRAC